MRDWRDAFLMFFRPREWARRENQRRHFRWRLECATAKQLKRVPPPPPNTIVVKP